MGGKIYSINILADFIVTDCIFSPWNWVIFFSCSHSISPTGMLANHQACWAPILTSLQFRTNTHPCRNKTEQVQMVRLMLPQAGDGWCSCILSTQLAWLWHLLFIFHTAGQENQPLQLVLLLQGERKIGRRKRNKTETAEASHGKHLLTQAC